MCSSLCLLHKLLSVLAPLCTSAKCAYVLYVSCAPDSLYQCFLSVRLLQNGHEYSCFTCFHKAGSSKILPYLSCKWKWFPHVRIIFFFFLLLWTLQWSTEVRSTEYKNFPRKIIFFCCLARYHCIRPCSVWKWKHQKSFAGSGGKPKAAHVIKNIKFQLLFYFLYIYFPWGFFCNWLVVSANRNTIYRHTEDSSSYDNLLYTLHKYTQLHM